MKKLITVFLITIASAASAQWSNTSNLFYDSLHTPVSTAAQSQRNPIVVNSFPDGGYFVIWEDDRNLATTKTDIYAQKYDAGGNSLWADNGVPVANGPNAQRYVFSSNQDYRNRSFAATDSAGGFYLGYIDDSVTNYSWERITAQHMLGNGTPVYPGAGFIIAAPNPNIGYTYSAPQLIADGNKGFYLSFSQNTGGENYIFVYDYKDEGGTMKNYGGGRMNENAIQRKEIGPCGIRYYLDYPAISVIDYNIWSDLQGGCNVVMSLNGNGLGQYHMLGYNRVFRAKKNATVKTFNRNTSGVACQAVTTYTKGTAYPLYTFKKDDIVTACGGGSGPVYVQTTTRLLSNGYQLIDEGGYDYNFPKGVTVSTSGGINVDLIAVTKRTYTNNTLSNFVVPAYAYASEKFDSIPFQRASYSNPDIGFNPVAPLNDQLTFFRDTLLASSSYYPDFSFAAGGKNIYAASLMSTSGDRLVRLQHLTVERTSSTTFALQYKSASKYGEVIGKEASTGFTGYNISYDFPLITTNNVGDALFYIREYYRSARISPIGSGADLLWGAMGKPVGTGVYNNSYYNFEQPAVALDPIGGSGLIAWKDNRTLPIASGENIFMRHIDHLEDYNYQPPNKKVRLLPNPYGPTITNPAVLFGTSKNYTTLEAYGSYGNNAGTSPVAEILDKYSFGSVAASVYQNSSALRKYNNQAYLDRNYTLKAENNPSGAYINLRLFFTKEEFNALKGVDNSLITPGDLVVIKQPNGTLTTPSTYSPVAGEEVLIPVGWDSLPGGYYIESRVTGFGNFFIQKTGIAALCPGGSTSILSSITGSSYQWQVNTGSGFGNISNNSFYSGVNTATLQLNNIPSSFAGFRYLCVVNGVNSTITSLHFTNSWSGTVDNNWENAANWSCGSVPDANTDVMLNAGTVIVNSNATCRSITINPGVTFSVSPGYIFTVTNK